MVVNQVVATHKTDRCILFEAQSGTHAVRDILELAQSQLSEWGAPATAAGPVQIVLAEVLNNVVEHAYGFREGEPFSLDMALDGPALTCVIRDFGTPFPDGTPPRGEAVALDGPTSSLPEGGFGWFLIRQLTEALSYDRTNGCNTLSLRFALAD